MPCTASIDQCLQEWAIGCTQILTEEIPQAEAGDPRVDVEEPSAQELALKAHRPGEQGQTGRDLRHGRHERSGSLKRQPPESATW